MPRYVADPTQDTAGFPILAKGDYRLRIGEPKSFKGETKQGERVGQVNFGVAYTCTVVGGPVDLDGNTTPESDIGKKVYNRLYYHTQESRNFSKGFILAAFGYNTSEEEQFNEGLRAAAEENPDDPALDWSFDPDTGECGEAWRSLTNREIVASLSISQREGMQPQQRWESVRPVP